MVAIFRQKTPVNFFTLLIFGIGIKLPIFLHPHLETAKNTDSLFYKQLLTGLSHAGATPFIYSLIAFLLLFIQALMLNRFMNVHRMMSQSSYFPGMAYMLITSLLPEWNYFSAPLLVNTLMLLILNLLFRMYNMPKARGLIFNIGLILGLGGFLFFPALSFIFWILLGLMVMRPFRLNEWLLCLAGLVTPLYFFAIYLFVTGHLNRENLVPYFSINIPSIQQSVWMAGTAFLLLVPFLAGGYYVQDGLRRMLIQVRKGWSLLLLFLLGSMFIPFVNGGESLENWVLVAIPFAAFHACTYLYAGLRVLPLLLFWATVAFIIGFQYYGPGW